MAISRESLYEEVWARPMLEVAQKYGVSGSYLARICRELSIPTPSRGYWARLRSGTKIRRPSLLPVRPGEDLEWDRSGRAKREPWPYPKPPEQFHRHRLGADEPSRMHPLVEPCRATLAAFQESPYSSDFLKTLKRSTLDVHLSRAELDRGMAVLNAILVGLERCGYPVEIAGAREPVQWVDFKPKDPKKSGLCYPSNWWNPWPPTIVRIGTLSIGLSFYEIMEEVLVKEVKNKWIPVGDDPIPTTKRGVQTIRTQTRNMPGGRLAVRAYSPYPGAPWEQFWCEAKRGEWASAPPSIVRALELAAPTIADLVEKAWKKREEDQRRWEAECKARKEREALARQEEARIKEIKRREKAFQKSQEELMNIVKEWARAKRVEAFFGEILSRCSEADGMNLEEVPSMSNQRLSERIGLARNLLGGTDALVRFLEWRTPEERISDGED